MNNKKAIELSVNFLVILIIAIVVFGFGIYLTFKFFGSAQDIPGKISDPLQQEINQMLSHGEKVALPINQQTIPAGKHFVFGLGISNMLNNAATNTFSLDIKLVKFIDPDDNVFTAGDSEFDGADGASKYLKITYINSYTLENGEQKSIPIAVSVLKDAPSGTYILNVEVTYDTSIQYSPIQKLYVVVP